MRAAIYTRVSTQEQGNNNSIPTQMAACQRYAEQHELTVIATLHDIESGATLNRPGLDKLRQLIQNRMIDAVIVYSLDRLSRNVAHIMLLRDERQRCGVGLHYCVRGESNGSAEDNLFDTIEGAFAEYERLKIKERMVRGTR